MSANCRCDGPRADENFERKGADIVEAVHGHAVARREYNFRLQRILSAVDIRAFGHKTDNVLECRLTFVSIFGQHLPLLIAKGGCIVEEAGLWLMMGLLA